jgi:hypothetical protein
MVLPNPLININLHLYDYFHVTIGVYLSLYNCRALNLLYATNHSYRVPSYCINATPILSLMKIHTELVST